MSDFVRLGALASLTVGFVGTMTNQYVQDGVPFLRSLNIKPFDIDTNDLKYISAEFNGKISKSILHKDDIVIVRTGVPGTCCVIPDELDGCNCSDVVIVRADNRKVNTHYLAAYINFWGQKQISNNKVGAVQKHFNVHSAEELLIYLPSREEQEKIANIVICVNKKIGLNSRINDNLAQQLRLLYDYWFTQFDFPDENGKPYRSSGGQMVWNDDLKRHIPNSWGCDNLYHIADYVNGLTCQKYRPVNGEKALPVIKIKEMHDGITADTELVSANIPLKNIVQSGDILFSWSASLEIAFWFGRTAGLNQHIFKVIPKASFSREYVYLQLSEYIVQFVRIAESRKTTMGHITSDHLNESRVVVPPTEVIQKFTTIARPIFEELKVCHAEMEHLQSLRDWLLPMLMNGQATISD